MASTSNVYPAGPHSVFAVPGLEPIANQASVVTAITTCFIAAKPNILTISKGIAIGRVIQLGS